MVRSFARNKGRLAKILDSMIKISQVKGVWSLIILRLYAGGKLFREHPPSLISSKDFRIHGPIRRREYVSIREHIAFATDDMVAERFEIVRLMLLEVDTHFLPQCFDSFSKEPGDIDIF